MPSMPAENLPTFGAMRDESNTTAATTLTVYNVMPDNFAPFGKPNAIVRPVRRNESLDDMVQPQPLRNGLDHPIVNIPTLTVVDLASKPTKIEINAFTKGLDLKLKNFQKDKKNSSRNVNNILF